LEVFQLPPVEPKLHQFRSLATVEREFQIMTNATDSTYSSIRRAIMAGRYAPGAQLKEEHLAEIMGVSRTPVRAALQRLVNDQLLRSEPHRGVFVAEWTARDIQETFELRLLLDPHAAGLAAVRATEDQIEAMRMRTDRMESYTVPSFHDKLPEIQRENHAFHNLILEASELPRLRSIATSLTDMPMTIGTFYFYSEADMQRSIQHHRELITAIEARDRELAREVMSVHLRVTHGIFRRNRQGSAEHFEE
jgi:DNA-binding GntR family transcriptional regulator